ncbi:elongation factor P, partial [Candidatus Berkelbacteria bacterium]|nr:elongation factor P [Candidatus Berkelbacteria bacterium]
MLSITQLQPGVACVYNNKPYIVIESSHEKQGRGGGIQHVKLRCLYDGTTLQQNFKGNVSLDEAVIERTQGQFLYQDNDGAHCMDQTTYDQITVAPEYVPPSLAYVPEGTVVDIVMYDGRAVTITPPIKVSVSVAHADPGIKGDRASAGTKAIELQTGATIQAPLFVKTGDRIVVDTRTGSYVER